MSGPAPGKMHQQQRYGLLNAGSLISVNFDAAELEQSLRSSATLE